MSDERIWKQLLYSQTAPEAKVGNSGTTNSSLGYTSRTVKFRCPTRNRQPPTEAAGKVCSNSIYSFEEACLHSMKVRWQQEKEASSSTVKRYSPPIDVMCGFVCYSRIELLHMQSIIDETWCVDDSFHILECSCCWLGDRPVQSRALTVCKYSLWGPDMSWSNSEKLTS